MNKNRSSVIENEIQAFVIERAMRPGLVDLFSYKSRATKRLLRILMRLAETVAESKLVGEEAITLEVWFACIAPVSQGYWRSVISELKKKAVLDEFYRHAFNIIINDIVIPSSRFQSAGPAEQDLLLQAMHVDVRKNFELRAKEYVDAIVDCINERPLLPLKLTKIIVQNLFGANGNGSRESEIMAEVTVPIIEAFGNAVRGTSMFHKLSRSIARIGKPKKMWRLCFLFSRDIAQSAKNAGVSEHLIPVELIVLGSYLVTRSLFDKAQDRNFAHELADIYHGIAAQKFFEFSLDDLRASYPDYPIQQLRQFAITLYSESVNQRFPEFDPLYEELLNSKSLMTPSKFCRHLLATNMNLDERRVPEFGFGIIFVEHWPLCLRKL